MSKNKNTELVSLEDWPQTFIRTIVVENIKLLADEERRLGPEYKGHLFSSFLASYVGAIVYKPLQTGSPVTCAGFAAAKSLIQESVAAGFTGAVNQGTKSKVEYYCQVRQVPEPISKKVN